MSEEALKVHYNKPQLRAMAVMAQHVRAVWARGTGKSDGLIAPFMANNVFQMPRSMGAIEGRSFAQILTRTLPPLIRGLERLGYRLNRDFVVREKPLKGWENPLFTPLDWHNAMAWRNGSASLLVSQQNPGSANGPSIDWVVADEAKFLKKEQHDEELLPAMRGNRDRFGHLSCHHSTCLATDMPTSPGARWILEEEKLMDTEVINLILATQFEIGKLRHALLHSKLSSSSARVYESRIRTLEGDLNALRIGTVYYTEASAMDNVEVLGTSYIMRMKMVLPDYLFRTSILNMRPDRVEGGFYPDLNDDRHTYFAKESKYVYQAGNELFTGEKELDDCRKDGDLVPGIPIEIGPDFGASFNCLVIGQLFDKEFNVLNQVYVKHPGKIKDLAKAFHNYYQWHTPRRYRLYFDHTMIGEDAVREYGFIIELERELKELGWEGDSIYIGQAPGHHEKYVFWGRRFADAEPNMPMVRFNAENCEPTLLSMRLAAARQTRRGFEKDKTPERDPNADQAETTHLSDACDLLVIGRFVTLDAEESASVSAVYG
jgi:hypothetical protein